MITGSNNIYTPVDAYGVETYADGMISGGSGDNIIPSNGVRFLWIYNPDNPYTYPSGFSGNGWFENVSWGPIGYFLDHNPLDFEQFIQSFSTSRTNLNDVFSTWQAYVTEQSKYNNDVAQKFIEKIGGFNAKNCWSLIG